MPENGVRTCALGSHTAFEYGFISLIGIALHGATVSATSDSTRCDIVRLRDCEGRERRHVARKAGLKLSNSIKRSVFTFFPDRLPFYHIFHMDMDDGGEGIVPFRWRASSRRVGVRAEHQRGRPGGMPEPPVTICLRLLYRRMQLMQLSMLQLLSHSMRRVLDGKHLWQLLLHV